MNQTGKTDTPLEVTGDLQFSDQANGGGVVRSGAHLSLSVQMNGKLTVDEGATVQLSGQLKGPAEILGTVDVTGQLAGSPHVGSSGQLTFATGSSIVRSGQTLVVTDSGEFRPISEKRESFIINGQTTRWFYQPDGTLLPDQS